MKNAQKCFLILSAESDEWYACIHTSMVTEWRLERETAKVREHTGTMQTGGQRSLQCLFYILAPNFPCVMLGVVTMKEKKSRARETEKWREEREME